MHVLLGIRVQVMVPMHGGPPDHAALRGRLSDERDDELHDAAGLVRAVAEITVVPSRDTPHPDDIQRDRNPDGGPGHSSPDGRETGHVDEDEGDGGRIY